MSGVSNLKFLRRWILTVILIVSVSPLAYFAPTWWGYFLYTNQVRTLQQKCLTYSPSPDQIIYDTDPADRQKLLTLSPEYRAFNDWSVFHVPAAWHDFRGSYDCPDGTAFIHQRTSPAGHQRLVAVDILPIHKDTIELRGSVVNIAPLFNIKKLEGCRSAMGKPSDEYTTKPTDFIRIFAGQVDPQNASRFVIPADFGDGVKLIHCQLLDDDTVQIERP
jgi:hypothetical protein